ncbi:MAG: DUF58 domain-containing protein [Verrucomicrobiales bacterium]|nr:DUF58 domain-containing protein [Verrucomicrobiales bacterium]
MKPIYQLIYWGYRATSGGWYWASRRFTLAGLCVAGGFIVAGAVGSDIENTVIYQAFALLLALLLQAFACSFFFRARFSATRSLPRFGTAGLPLQYSLRVKNLTAKTQAGLTLLEEVADPRPKFPEWLAFQMAESRRVRPFRVTQRRRKNPFRLATVKEMEMPPMPPNGETEVRVEVLPMRRGVLHFTGVTLARPDPLGLFRSFVKISAPQTALILPKRYPIPTIALPGALRYQEGGVALAANVGRSEEFVSLREYRHGDPMRHIHWRSWAKVGKPIVKEFEDEFFVRHALVLDTFDEEPNSEILEEAVSVAASFACTILTQESLLDLLFVGNQSYCFTAGRGLAHAEQMLEILASVKNCADKKFETLEHLVISHISAVSGCICVLQRWDEARKSFVKKLRALNIPLLVLVVVGAGEKKPDAGPMRDEPENFRVLEIGRIAEELAKLQ